MISLSTAKKWVNSPLKHFKESCEIVYSYFEKGCRKKCTRQSRKALWVVLSSLFFKEIWKNWYERPWKCVCDCWRKATKVGSTATVVRNSVLIISHITFRNCRVHIFPTTFLETAVFLGKRGTLKQRMSRAGASPLQWCSRRNMSKKNKIFISKITGKCRRAPSLQFVHAKYRKSTVQHSTVYSWLRYITMHHRFS